MHGEANRSPQYGDVRRLSGQYSSSVEGSALNLCDDRDVCYLQRNVDGSEQTCWTVFANESDTLLRQNDEEYAKFWVEGNGRIAVLPGSFGHLGQYTCQVEITDLTVSDKFDLNRPAQ